MNLLGKLSSPFIFIIDFEGLKPRLWTETSDADQIQLVFPSFTNVPFKNTEETPVNLQKAPISKRQYAIGFEKVKTHLKAGDSFLVNYTCITPLTLDRNHEEIFHSVKSKYKIWYKGEFVCFSPETFVRIQGGRIFSYPMKGTIDADLPNARELILSDTKEMAEHATIVDLIRNDLSMVATDVEVTQYRNYEVIQTAGKNLGQVSSEISGILPTNYKENLGHIIFSLVPAGSISGAPKKKTVEIIREAEQKERGFYTGICGYFDGDNLDSCVLIRYLDQQFNYRSGGGITYLSVLEDEYQEMIDKIYVPIY